MVTRRQFAFTATAAAAAAALPTTAHAIANIASPTLHRDVTLIVPLPKNGPTDAVARLIAEPLAKVLGVAVKVENITGDWGMTGAAIASAADADGTTLVLGQRSTHAALPLMKGKYNAMTDFTPIGLVDVSPVVVLVRRDLPFNNLQTLQAYLKANPNRLAVSHGGLGSASSEAAVQLKKAFGVIDLRERGYAGTASALADLSNGDADILCDQMVTALPAIRAGQVKAIGMMSVSRNHAMPGVLTGAQQGFAELRASNWHGLFAPKGMAADVQVKLAAAINTMLEDVTVARQMRERGLHVPFSEQRGPDALVALQRREMDDIARTVTPALV